MAQHLSNHLAIKDNIVWDPDTNYIPCFAHMINLVVQKFIRAVIVTPDDDDEGNIDIGNGDDFTLDIGDDDLAFGEIISKLRGIANSIHGTSRWWELFEQACRSYKITPTTIPQDITIRWNSTFRMLQHSIYLKHPIPRYVDDLGDSFKQLVLTERECQQAEVLLLFLLSFQRCTSGFESNNTTPEIDYVFLPAIHFTIISMMSKTSFVSVPALEHYLAYPPC